MTIPTLILLSLTLILASSQPSLRETLPRSQQCLTALETCLPLAAAGQSCPILPIPAEARNIPVGEEGFTLTELRRDVYQYYDGFFTTLMIKSGTRFAFVDLPDSPGSRIPTGSMTRLTQAAGILMGDVQPRRFDIVYSHFHIDHIGATQFFIDFFTAKFPRLRVRVWGSETTRKQLAECTVPLAPPPDRIVGENGRKIRLRRGLELELSMMPGHTDGDVVTLVRRSGDGDGIVMFVDVLFPLYAPLPLLGGADSVKDYLNAQEAILRLDFNQIVTGHLRAGNRRDLQINVEYTKDLLDAAQTGILADRSEAIAPLFGRFMDPNDVAFGNSAFLGRDVFRGTAINVCAEIMLRKWGCRIAGVDLTVVGNCNLGFNIIVSLNGPHAS